MAKARSQSSGKWILLAASLLLASGATWLVLFSRGHDVSAASAIEESSSTAQAGERADFDGAPAAAANERADVGAGSSAAIDTASASTPSHGPTITLVALQSGSLEPLAGVEFAWAAANDEATRPGRYWAWFTDGDIESRLDSTLHRVSADAEGRAEIPRPSTSVIVLASAPGWWGMQTLEEDPDPRIEVVLAAERQIAVQVVDASGRPVGGVPVALRSSFWGGAVDRLRARTSAEDGIAHLRHVGTVLRSGGGQEWLVALAIASPKPVSATIDPVNLPEAPVRLVLPEIGSCVVRLLGEGGEPPREPFDVSLSASLPTSGEERARRRPERDAATLIEVQDGVAVFPFVELGVELTAVARRSGGRVAETVRGVGPRRAGEQVELVLRLGRDVTTLRGRAVDETGSPLADREVHPALQFTGDNQWENELGAVRTDAAGSFQTDVTTRLSADEPCEFRLELREARSGATGRGSRPLPLPLPSGSFELGDVVIHELGIVLAGTVVDENGAPAPHAGVAAQTQIVGDWSDYEAGDYWWANGRCDDQGRFELRGRAGGDELSIHANHGDLRSRPLVVRRGSTDLVLRLERTGSIAGRVVRDSSAPGEVLMVGAQWAQPDEDVEGGMGEVTADGSFAVRKLMPGTYDITLRDPANWNDIKTIQGVVVRAGETTRDPRLDPIDLRGSRFLVRLTILDEREEPVPRGWFTRESSTPNESGSSDYGPIFNGKATIAHDGTGANVRLQAEGFCVLRLEKVLSDQTVHMRHAPTVHLTVRPAPALEPGVELIAMLQPDVPEPEDNASIPIGASGEGESRVPLTGTLAVTFYVQVGAEEDGVWETINDTHARIEVTQAPGTQTFELSLDAAKLAEATARAKAPRPQDE
jgi:hypothetical protein